MTEHKWARIIRAIADGKDVQGRPIGGIWFDYPSKGGQNPITHTYYEWRIKPTGQEKPMPTPHIHAASMLLYAQDAAETEKPWERWEYRREDSDYKWLTCGAGVCWYTDSEYRRKPPAPKTIKVTTHSGRVYEFPEPMRVAPEYATRYYVVSPATPTKILNTKWHSDSDDGVWLSRGLCHLTREAAEQHAAALLAVNRIV